MTQQNFKPKGIIVADATWAEIEQHIQSGGIGLLPVGASCKEHGLHLPMNADYLQADWLSRQLTRDHNLVVWPTVGYGHYPAFANYPGSCNLTQKTFLSVMVEIIQDIFQSGITKLIILNIGISTIKPIMDAKLRFATKPDNCLKVFNISESNRTNEVIKLIQEQPRGSHADEIETSIMLAIAPETVNMEMATASTDEMVYGPLNRFSPEAPNFSPSGVFGDATLATVEKGQLLIEALLNDLSEFINSSVA